MRSKREYRIDHNRRFDLMLLQWDCRVNRKRMFALACEQLQLSIRRRRDSDERSQTMDEEAFNALWIGKFAADVPQEQIEKYVLSNDKFCNYIWHVFSWRLLPDGTYLEGDEANRAYAEADKDGAFFIEPFEKTGSRPLRAALKSPRLIDMLCTEVYITAADFSWTYIKTHEGDSCGPYFYQKKH